MFLLWSRLLNIVKVMYLDLLTRVGLRWLILIDSFICLINAYGINESLFECICERIAEKDWQRERTHLKGVAPEENQLSIHSDFLPEMQTCLYYTPAASELTAVLRFRKKAYTLKPQARIHIFSLKLLLVTRLAKARRRESRTSWVGVQWIFRMSIGLPGLANS